MSVPYQEKKEVLSVLWTLLNPINKTLNNKEQFEFVRTRGVKRSPCHRMYDDVRKRKSGFLFCVLFKGNYFITSLDAVIIYIHTASPILFTYKSTIIAVLCFISISLPHLLDFVHHSRFNMSIAYLRLVFWYLKFRLSLFCIYTLISVVPANTHKTQCWVHFEKSEIFSGSVVLWKRYRNRSVINVEGECRWNTHFCV